MKTTKIILFLFFTGLFIVLLYLLLGIIYKSINIPLIALLGILLITDLWQMIKVFLHFMKHKPDAN